MSLTQFSKTLSASALTVSLSLAAASAQAFTFTTTGNWSNPVGGGSTVNYPTVGSEKQVRWGTTDGAQSGLGFTGTSNSANFGDVVKLGTLRHFNNVVFGNTISAVDLTIGLGFGGSLPVPDQTFNFTLNIDETPNQTPCTYPGVTICPDKISFGTTTSSQNFTVGGVAYTLEILGFGTTPNNPVNSFISEEGGTNSADLYGRVTEAQTNAAVPEPTTMAGLALASGGIAWVRRRRSASQA